jgi:isoprenylcysteine carboxyl methyltransferase (ICMT) family protein YpbQ
MKFLIWLRVLQATIKSTKQMLASYNQMGAYWIQVVKESVQELLNKNSLFLIFWNGIPSEIICVIGDITTEETKKYNIQTINHLMWATTCQYRIYKHPNYAYIIVSILARQCFANNNSRAILAEILRR